MSCFTSSVLGNLHIGVTKKGVDVKSKMWILKIVHMVNIAVVTFLPVILETGVQVSLRLAHPILEIWITGLEWGGDQHNQVCEEGGVDGQWRERNGDNCTA